MRMIDDHTGIEDLAVDECERLLGAYKLGRLALASAGPAIFPVNYVMADSDVVFRTADGPILRATAQHEHVAFEVDMADVDAGVGWSVLVKGDLDEVGDAVDIARLAALDLHPWSPGKSHWVRLRATELTGRRIVHVAPEMHFG